MYRQYDPPIEVSGLYDKCGVHQDLDLKKPSKKLNRMIYSKRCKTKEIINFLNDGVVKKALAKEAGIEGEYIDRYADEHRNVLELYARNAHTEYKQETLKYSYGYSKLKLVMSQFGNMDGIMALLSGLLPAFTASGLIYLLKVSDEEGNHYTWDSALIFLISTVMPIYIIFLFNFLKFGKGRVMKHTPLIPFLTGTVGSVLYIYIKTLTDLKFIKSVEKDSNVLIIFIVFSVLLILLTVISFWYFYSRPL